MDELLLRSLQKYNIDILQSTRAHVHVHAQKVDHSDKLLLRKKERMERLNKEALSH